MIDDQSSEQAKSSQPQSAAHASMRTFQIPLGTAGTELVQVPDTGDELYAELLDTSAEDTVAKVGLLTPPVAEAA